MDRIIARMKKSSARRGRGSGDNTPVRRLERRDALKDINYDAFSSAVDLSDSTSSLMTRSLEFPDRTSFRIFGGGDGEIQRIYKSLGVSGPDDLAISFDAWEACKKRSSSDVINRLKSLEFDNHQFPDLSEAGPSGDVSTNSTDRDNTELREIGDFSDSEDRVLVHGGIVENTRSRSIERTETILVKSIDYLVPNDVVAVSCGINGVRPPVLKPPPAMKQPPIDLQGSSSWDFLTHFAPTSNTIKRPSSSSSSSDNGYDEEEALEEEMDREIETEEVEASFLQSTDTADEACSFTTNEGGDSSSTVSNASPIYSSASIITSWQKGQLLGRGSFGSVYEGISG